MISKSPASLCRGVKPPHIVSTGAAVGRPTGEIVVICVGAGLENRLGALVILLVGALVGLIVTCALVGKGVG